jgi:hypothetical protein
MERMAGEAPDEIAELHLVFLCVAGRAHSYSEAVSN